MKTSAQSNAANKTQRLSLLKASKDHCKNTEPNKLATKEKCRNQQPASSLSNANESNCGFNDKPCSESKNDDDSSSGFDDESSSDSDDESY